VAKKKRRPRKKKKKQRGRENINQKVKRERLGGAVRERGKAEESSPPRIARCNLQLKASGRMRKKKEKSGREPGNDRRLLEKKKEGSKKDWRFSKKKEIGGGRCARSTVEEDFLGGESGLGEQYMFKGDKKPGKVTDLRK